MTAGPSLAVTDENLQEIVGAELGVLILSKTTCGACIGYEADIGELRRRGELADVMIGKMLLDRPGSLRFKKANPWLRGLDDLPLSMIFSRGRELDRFAASRGAYLVERLRARASTAPAPRR